VAFHFHWPLAEILDLEHPLRQAFVTRIGQINSGDTSEDETDGW
jgi:hypothetical protein